jgi:hypothetical protein
MARRSGKGIIIDDSTFQKKARALARKLKIDEYDFVKEQTGLLARDVAKYTPPFASFPTKGGKSVGTSKDAKQGKMAVLQSIAQIVTVKETGVLRWAKKTFKGKPIYRGKVMIAQGIIESESELAQWHRRNRRRNGRTLPLKGDQKYWVSKRLFNRYVKAEQKKVGIAKATFAKAALQLGAKGKTLGFISQHFGRASGAGRMARTGKGPYGLIRGSSPGLWHVFKRIPTIERDRLIKAVKRLEFIGKQAAKKSGFKVR